MINKLKKLGYIQVKGKYAKGFTDKDKKNKSEDHYFIVGVPDGNTLILRFRKGLYSYTSEEKKERLNKARAEILKTGEFKTVIFRGSSETSKREKKPVKNNKDLFDEPFEHKKVINNKIKTNKTKFVINKQLHDYQIKAVDFALKHKHSIIELPTGRGKTLTALAIVNKITSKQPAKVLVLVPTTVLLDQWINSGFKESSVKASGVFSRSKEWSQFTVSTYQSAHRHVEYLPQYDVIIFDEVHHLFAPRYLDILRILMQQKNVNNKYIIGLTATTRGDNEEGSYIQNKYFPDRFSLQMKDFQNNKKTRIPVKIVKIAVKLDEESKSLYDDYTETLLNARRILGPRIQDWIAAITPNGGISAALGAKAISAYTKRKILLSEFPDKIKKIYSIISNVKGQFIVFNDTKEGMNRIKQYLIKRGIKADIINADVGWSDRHKIITGMKENKIRVLIGGNAISEGMDIPNIDNIIFSSLVVSSTRTYVQRLGRVLRPTPNKKVYVAIVYAIDTMEQKNAVKVYDILGEEYNK